MKKTIKKLIDKIGEHNLVYDNYFIAYLKGAINMMVYIDKNRYKKKIKFFRKIIKNILKHKINNDDKIVSYLYGLLYGSKSDKLENYNKLPKSISIYQYSNFIIDKLKYENDNDIHKTKVYLKGINDVLHRKI